jgi:cytochrome c oxidase subunit 4
MTGEAARIWRKNLLIWAALLALLAATFVLAHVPLGAFNAPIGLFISSLKAALVLLLFMGLWRSRAIMSLAAGAGLFWLAIMFTLTFSDVLSR